MRTVRQPGWRGGSCGTRCSRWVGLLPGGFCERWRLPGPAPPARKNGDGDRAQQWERRDADNQRFTLEATEDGYYRITAQHSSKDLEVTDAGTAVWQWDWSGGTDRQWRPDHQKFRLDPHN
ncbi:RICIN domain-containing protein [Streptomyces sp. NBC_01244]|uniref:RICIN domain-containing protein n=1 Tax=Streptomyces sp. NBC_01244 TaxID=2903797 RepID=UPI003FA3A8B7